MHRWVMRVTIVSMALVAAVGCRSMTGQSLGTNLDNATTTAEVKAKLAADKLQNLTWVGVDTNAGTVYLTGTAATEAQKARAADLALQAAGVKQVVNNIKVQPAAAASASPGSASRTLTGEVTSVDHGTGQVMVTTRDGDLMLRLPAATLADVKPGDQVTVGLTRR